MKIPRKTPSTNQLTARLGATAIIAFLLSSCTSTEPKLRHSIPIEIFNHSSIPVRLVQPQTFESPQYYVLPHQHGEKSLCCTYLPEKWAPNLRITIEWVENAAADSYEKWPYAAYSPEWDKERYLFHLKDIKKRAEIEIPYYDRLGPLDLHFFPCGIVKATAVPWIYGQPEYPHNEPLKMEEHKTCPTNLTSTHRN